MATYMGDVCQATGRYQDQQGNNKTSYVKLGRWFKDDQGRISLKLDALPMNRIKTGQNGEIQEGCWLSLFENQNNNNNQNNNQNRQNNNNNGNFNNNGGGAPY